ncbi:MAG: hypothetical protein U0175_18715 [Caldilineaceae bacterium]
MEQATIALVQQSWKDLILIVPQADVLPNTSLPMDAIEGWARDQTCDPHS